MKSSRHAHNKFRGAAVPLRGRHYDYRCGWRKLSSPAVGKCLYVSLATGSNLGGGRINTPRNVICIDELGFTSKTNASVYRVSFIFFICFLSSSICVVKKCE
ncbi:hypothetical protein CDAR_476861 [Caerostris darwini]|uniref:Uncharacterized protein n=1 Tax=Caerostris darwini TaxID=1538125 RepID=A0AAV4U540_9ARAC|nr:hypothetical protein CDAR_476861 [Caerostris darwini]